MKIRTFVIDTIKRVLQAYHDSVIKDILSKIPHAASSTNQLVDKDYVDTEISSASSTYISYNGHPFPSLELLEAYEGEVSNGDYAFVVSTDTHGNTLYTRYKWVAKDQKWEEEYVLNNSSFDSDQWAAINSGIDSADVEKLTALPTKVQLDNLFDGKQDKLTFDSTPTTDSTNPVTSDGIKTALDTKQDELTFDTTPTAGSTNPVTSNGIKTELDKKQDKTLVEQVAFTAGQSTTKSIDPNKIYECTFVNVMSFAFNAATVTNTEKCEYCIKFNVGATVPTLTLPNTIKWAEELTLEASTHYVILINYENGSYYGDWEGYKL